MHATFGADRTYPQGFLDFLALAPRRGRRIGDHELQPAGLERFNAALRSMSPEAPTLTLDQFASAAQRALDRHPDGSPPAFVTSRLGALARLETMAGDAGWNIDVSVSRCLQVVRDYIAADDGLVPDGLQVVGRLDDAVLVDVALQLACDELADYEDFCRFRKVAADFAGIAIDDIGLTRAQWLEALLQSRHQRPRFGRERQRYVPDPRATLFHIS